MTTPARKRAEACFAVARSATFEGERDAAIGRGLAICEKAGLDPSTFDIPGRSRTTKPRSPRMDPAPASRYREDLYTRPRAPDHYDQDELRDALRRYAETLRQAADLSRAAFDENVQDALRRQFDAAAAEAKARDRARDGARAVEKAEAKLWALGTPCYRTEGGLWAIQLKEGLVEVSGDELIALAELAERKATEKRSADPAWSSTTATCPICRQYAHESRFGAPCYGCVPEDRA